jgi:hypothetical protein
MQAVFYFYPGPVGEKTLRNWESSLNNFIIIERIQGGEHTLRYTAISPLVIAVFARIWQHACHHL